DIARIPAPAHWVIGPQEPAFRLARPQKPLDLDRAAGAWNAGIALCRGDEAAIDQQYPTIGKAQRRHHPEPAAMGRHGLGERIGPFIAPTGGNTLIFEASRVYPAPIG